MKNTKLFVLACLAVLLTGCLQHYVYQSRSAITYSDETVRPAVIYWEKDEGRLWYGKEYKSSDSDIAMRVCERVSFLTFVPDNKTLELTLLSQPGDQLMAAESGSGKIQMLNPPKKVGPGETCGRITLHGKHAKIADLQVGAQPTVSVLCRNPQRPDRYPAVGIYSFNKVGRKEGKNQLAPDACM